MGNARLIAGPQGNGNTTVVIDDGTMCRAVTLPPGPTISAGPAPFSGSYGQPSFFLAEAKYDVSDELAYAWLTLMTTQGSKLPQDDLCYYASCRADLQLADQNTERTFAGELGETLTAPTNLPGNVVGAGTTAWSLATAKRVLTAAEADILRDAVQRGKKVGLDLANGGRLELYDANHHNRKAARGAERKAYPPKLRIRIKNVPAVNVSSSIPVRGGLPRVDATPAAIKSLTQRLSEADWKRARMGNLPLRRLVTGNAVGAALAVGPQAVSDWRKSSDWRQFASLSAQSQPGNVVGFAASVAVVAGVGVFITLSAPVALGVALVVGVAAQAGFNAAGGGDFVKRKVDEMLR